MAWRRTDYLDQYRSSETICLRPTDILQLNKTKRTFHQVQFIWKPTRLQILQEKQILHRVYANHIYITKPQQQTRPNWRHKPPCEILLSHLVVTGPCRNEARNLENCILRLVVDIGYVPPWRPRKNNSIIFRLVEILSGWQHVSAMRSYDCFLVVITVIPNYTFGCCRNDNVYHSMDK